MVIVDPDLSPEKRDPLFERMEEIISQEGGMLILREDWGTRKLAYEIKKKPRGQYLRLDYCGSGALVSELERSFRIDDRVMKYMTVLLEKEADMDAIKAEMAAAEAAEAETEAAPDDADAAATAEEKTETPETAEEK
jgi:small subunit ribosomal protein S6